VPPEIVKAIADPAVWSCLEVTVTLPEPNSPPDTTRAFLNHQFDYYCRIAQRIGLRFE